MTTMTAPRFWLRFAPLLVFLLVSPRGTESLSTGAVGCEGGKAAVGGKHLTGTVTTGELSTDNIEFQIDGIPLNTSSLRTLTAGTSYTWSLISGGSPYRGFLVRLDGGDASLDTTADLSTSMATAQVATTACAIPYGVGGITHTSNALKVSQSGTLLVDAPSNGMRLDVTVVIANRDGISTYYYSGFAINVVSAETSTGTLITDVASTTTPPLTTATQVTTTPPLTTITQVTAAAPTGVPVVSPTSSPEPELYLRFPTCSPTSPCGECMGDCDTDNDCEGDLECFQRPNYDVSPVPYCSGQGIGGRDYCYKAEPNSLRPRLPECSTTFPCDACQGDCDSDAECSGNLRCFRREMNDLTPVYGCSGTGIAGLDYCYDPLAMTQPATSTTNSTSDIGARDFVNPTDSVVYSSIQLALRDKKCKDNEPCLMCEGECQDDSGCSGDLVCFLRSADSMNSIPNCAGQPTQGVSYCTSQVTGILTLDSNRCNQQNPCEKCHGECRVDSDCQGNLACFLRNDYTSIPGCDGMGDFGRSYCWDPNDFIVSRRHLRALSNGATSPAAEE